MIDMRSYRIPPGISATTMRDLHSRRGATGLAETRARGLRCHLESDRRRHADPASSARTPLPLGDGPPEQREHEIADLLSFMKRAGIRSTVWLTADMHYTAAHHYDPNRATYQDFEPFWEFVSARCMCLAPEEPARSTTFGPKRCSRRVAARSRARTSPPVFGLQFFGPRRYRRQDRSDDRDVEGRRQPRPVVGRYRASSGRAARSDHGSTS
jgi:phosphodiesterase/alkaline phosphatase D-like protein